jgi:predicted N-acetyltransferase YhbS
LEYTEATADRTAEIAALVRAAFTDAEGAAEGAAVGDLARALLETTPPGDIRVFLAETEARVAGAAIFTRLACADPDRRVMLLSPMAVATDLQGQGLGQGLLRHALDALRAAGVEVAVTYGDPAFYARLGFAPVAPEVVPPPRPLTQPEGWLARPLGAPAIAPLPGPCRTVPALDAPAFW